MTPKGNGERDSSMTTAPNCVVTYERNRTPAASGVVA